MISRSCGGSSPSSVSATPGGPAPEHLAGARQDRMLTVTVLVPAASEIPIPVSCVDHGRWG